MSNKYIVGCFQIYYFFQLSTSKGLIAGNLRYMEEDGTRVQCTCSATVSILQSHLLRDSQPFHFELAFIPCFCVYNLF